MDYYNYSGTYATTPKEFLSNYKDGDICTFYRQKEGKNLINGLSKLVNKSSDIEMYAYAYALARFGDMDDKHRSFKIVSDLVDGGFVPAYNLYGVALYEGKVVSKKEAAAYKWFEKASNEGFAIAMYNLGRGYILGEGVAKDEQKGLSLMDESAFLGYNSAINFIGGCYLNGKHGYEQSDYMAFEQYSTSSMRYSGRGAFMLGTMYEEGRGCEQSYARAFDKYKYAASLDYVDAQVRAGEWLLLGKHVEKDLQSASHFLTEAAENGNVISMYNLGLYILNGEFWWEDKKMGKAWMQKAADAGDEDAKRILSKIK